MTNYTAKAWAVWTDGPLPIIDSIASTMDGAIDRYCGGDRNVWEAHKQLGYVCLPITITSAPGPQKATERPTEPMMSKRTASRLQAGDIVEMLVCGTGDVGGMEGVSYGAGALCTVDHVGHYSDSQGLTVTIIAPNGVINVFDELDYNGEYPFKLRWPNTL